ncbi:MAG: sulfatase-like hydrolase/transferase [Candidatus Sumerlaeota bacterium]|nr:sulfatase-like hydrolase/transferase [Candidatus Sumerlaeota bacterium]
MNNHRKPNSLVSVAGVSRRDFLKTGAFSAAALAAGTRLAPAAPAAALAKRPNFVFIIADQLCIDTISGHGCSFIQTPNIDRLLGCGMSFQTSYSANPLCSPARSAMFSGHMPSETGVVTNGIPIRSAFPNLGQWLSQEGYESVHIGKWHMPATYPTAIDGFLVIPGGIGGQGNIGDTTVSRACQGYLANRSKTKPFFLVASFLQPHDICEWVSMHMGKPTDNPYPEIEGQLPPLPANYAFDAATEPARLGKSKRPTWTDAQWRYYLWSYDRHVEMVDAEIGRVLDALEASVEAKNTVVVLTADHGEGTAHHHLVLKNNLYDAASRVPFIVSFPQQWTAGKKDTTHLVSGTDIMPTICDYAGVKPPKGVVGRSVKPLIDGTSPEWREFVVSEVVVIGRMVRTPDYKYVVYKGDPLEQLFDMKNDPGETKNVAGDSQFASVLEDHRKRLKEFESKLDLAPAKPGAKAPKREE